MTDGPVSDGPTNDRQVSDGQVSTAPLLEVDNLTVALRTSRGIRRAVDGISFSIREGEILGIAGESGSGKTLTALSLLGLLPIGARTSGSVRFEGRELLGLKRRQLREVRGKLVALVSQDPATALHPLLRIDVQMTEHVRAHLGFSNEQARERAIEMLDRGADTRPRSGAVLPPASVLGGYATTDSHRHGAGVRAAVADCGRADDGARRHGAGRDIAAAGPAAPRTGLLGHDHHPRPGRDVERCRTGSASCTAGGWPSTERPTWCSGSPATPTPRA